MADLNAQEVAALKRAGFGPSAIRQYQLGKAGSVLGKRMDLVLSGVTAGPRTEGGTIGGGAGAIATGSLTPRANSIPQNQTPIFGRSAPSPSQGGVITAPTYTAFPAPKKSTPIPAGIPASRRNIPQTGPGAYNPSTQHQGINVENTKGGSKFNSFGGPFGTKAGYAGTPMPEGWVPWVGDKSGDALEIPGLSESAPFPDLGQVDIPVITPRDFTNEVTGIADRVFAPLFADYEKQKTGATERGQRNSQVLGGLYNNLVSSIATEAANSANRYTGEQQATAQRGQDLTASIGNAYGSSNDAIAKLAGQMGGNAAAAAAPNAADSAWAQSMAGIGNKAQQDYVANQASSAADSAARRQDVARTTGVVAQENNLTNTAQDIANIESLVAGSRMKQGLTAVDIAQQLAGRDLSAQQANAGYSMQGQQMNNQNTLAAWEAQNAANSRTDQYNQWKYGQQYKEQQDDWQRLQDQAKLQIDIAKAGGQGGAAGGGLKLDDYSGTDKVWASAVNQYGQEKGTKLANFANNVAMNSDAAKSGDMYGYINDMVNQAAANGFSPEEARSIALNAWNNGLRQPTG